MIATSLEPIAERPPKRNVATTLPTCPVRAFERANLAVGLEEAQR
jgi:hypothetical protein